MDQFKVGLTRYGILDAIQRHPILFAESSNILVKSSKFVVYLFIAVIDTLNAI